MEAAAVPDPFLESSQADVTPRHCRCDDVQYPTFALFLSLTPQSTASHRVSTCCIGYFLSERHAGLGYFIRYVCNICLTLIFARCDINFIDYTLVLGILENHVAQHH